MTNRIDAAIARARKENRKLFCAYLTLGFPNLSFTRRAIREMERAGADFIELGFPFSDPMADGPVIQRASEFALKKKISLRDAMELVRTLRREGCAVPLIFFSYYNPVFHQKMETFAGRLAASGFDGVICPDLPPDEDSRFPGLLKKENLKMIYLATPTTDAKRLSLIARRSEGFIYYVSLKGVTGMRKALSSDLGRQVARIKRASRKPVLVGFGVSNAAQVAHAARVSDGVIVGSAIVNVIEKSGGDAGKVGRFVATLARAARKNSR